MSCLDVRDQGEGAHPEFPLPTLQLITIILDFLLVRAMFKNSLVELPV